MAEHAQRVRLEQIDWPSAFPFLRLFTGFRMAIHPARLGLALLLVVLLYLGGMALDLVFGPQPIGGPTMAPGGSYVGPDAGIFETTLRFELAAFERLIHSALSLDFGFTSFLTGEGRGGVLVALAQMILFIPAWLLTNHPGFLSLYLLYAFLLTALIGGAISRLAILQATVDRRASAFQGLRFAGRRYASLVLGPLLPALIVVLLLLLLAVGGAVFFNLPGLDIVGSLLFGPMLLLGLAAAVVLVGIVLGLHLVFPALAAEATDGFDAVSRAMGYVRDQPWRYLFYWGVMLVYGALTYLFVGLVLFLAIWLTKHAMGLWAFAEVEPGLTRWDAILPSPRLGELTYSMEQVSDRGTAYVAAAVVWVWVKLLIALLPAYAVSFYFCEQSWIYLLLRRWADGTGFDEVHLEPEDRQPDAEAATPEKVEGEV